MDMDQEKKKFLALNARMEGEAVIVSSIGKQVRLSEMELICLVNLAEMGVLAVFAQLDGPEGDDAARQMNDLAVAIRRAFSKNDKDDGLVRLMTSTSALIRGERFLKYLAG